MRTKQRGGVFTESHKQLLTQEFKGKAAPTLKQLTTFMEKNNIIENITEVKQFVTELTSPKSVYILGEDHHEQHVTDEKIMRITTSGRHRDYVLFTEDVKPRRKNTGLGIKECMPIKNKTPSVIEALFQIFTFFPIFKNKNPIIPGFKQTPSAIIVTLIDTFADFKCTEKELIENPSNIFEKVKANIIKLCVGFGGTGEFIRSRLPSLTFDTIDESFGSTPLFKISYFLVDEAIIQNVVSQQSGPDVAFILIVGEDHVDNLAKQLTSSGYMVMSFKHEQPFKGGKRTRTRTRINRKKTRIRRN
jgi:hypothetical protein